MKSGSVSAALAALVACAGLLLVPGCGGGVGSGGTGMAIGTVNGFGSVIVDGMRYDDSSVRTLREDAPGVETRTQARLGERAEVRFTDDGIVTALMVDATLVGTVSSVGAPGAFTVLGQSVTANGDPALGPVTQFGGGYTGVASVRAGDPVEVHGLIVVQDAGFVIQATRIQGLAALPTYLKATGIVGSAAVGSFAIGSLRVDTGTAAVVPVGAALADGTVVSVLAPATTLALNLDGTSRVVAAKVRIASLRADTVTLSGSVGALDLTTQRFTLGGVRISYAGATISPAGASLASRYVVVTGHRLTEGSLQATSIAVRDGTREPEAELKGEVTAFSSVGSFQVRGVAVDASGAKVEGCPPGGLADGVFVELHGSLAPTGVIATEVHCEDAPDGATVERTGVGGSVDTTAQTFVLTTSLGLIQVRWTGTTTFEKVSAATLSGKRVEVKGQLSGSVLTAQTIELED